LLLRDSSLHISFLNSAGFGIKKKAFFYNFGAVTTLGVVGTVLTATLLALGASLALSLIGLDKQTVASSLALGTIFSSTVRAKFYNQRCPY